MYPELGVSEPFALVTTTSIVAPAVPVGVSQVIVVSVTTTMFVALAPSNVTVFVPGLLFWKPVPVSARTISSYSWEITWIGGPTPVASSTCC